jgi:hypothetical protein
LAKELGGYDKEIAKLNETKKHLDSKKKKFDKSLKDVSNSPALSDASLTLLSRIDMHFLTPNIP